MPRTQRFFSGALQSPGPSRRRDRVADWVPALRSGTSCRTASGTRKRRKSRRYFVATTVASAGKLASSACKVDSVE